MNKLIVILGLCLTGCYERTDSTAISNNTKSANSPEFVADTPQGKLYRINIDMGAGTYNDRVYFFETNNIVTVNRTIVYRSGKQTNIRVEATGIK